MLVRLPGSISHLLRSSHLRELFPAKSIFPAYRRTKNLKEILTPSKLRHVNGSINHDRDLCTNFLVEDIHFRSTATGRKYFNNQGVNCDSDNVIYIANCSKCNLQYVGFTSTCLRFHFVIISHQCLPKKRCKLAVHFNRTQHDLLSYCYRKNCQHQESPTSIEHRLLTREAYWMTRLFTLQPSIRGWNLDPIKRICNQARAISSIV